MLLPIRHLRTWHIERLSFNARIIVYLKTPHTLQTLACNKCRSEMCLRKVRARSTIIVRSRQHGRADGLVCGAGRETSRRDQHSEADCGEINPRITFFCHIMTSYRSSEGDETRILPEFFPYLKPAETSLGKSVPQRQQPLGAERGSVQVLIRCNGNLAVVDCRGRLAAPRDSVIP